MQSIHWNSGTPYAVYDLPLMVNEDLLTANWRVRYGGREYDIAFAGSDGSRVNLGLGDSDVYVGEGGLSYVATVPDLRAEDGRLVAAGGVVEWS